jgi:alkylated DNA repair dioxygenase AlkB
MKKMEQNDLFDAPALPPGLTYQPDFLSSDEEAELVGQIGALPLQEALYRQYTARRRTVSFGSGYDFTKNRLTEAPPMPAFLAPLREKVARWLDIPADNFVHTLVTEYKPGTPLGWHRDVLDFEVVTGVSLAGWGRMRFRPYRSENNRKDVVTLDLKPRSVYVMRDVARWGWQHSIAPTAEHRYSITFRTAATGPRRRRTYADATAAPVR